MQVKWVPASKRGKRGKSRKWRAAKRKQAEAEQAERKRAREAKAGSAAKRERVTGADARTRFFERRELFRDRYGSAGPVVHAIAWLIHNCVAHPLLGLAPGHASVWLHDRTADWLNLSPVATRSELPNIANRRAWFLHNCVAHPLMGVAPFAEPFELHEATAERMDVEGWV